MSQCLPVETPTNVCPACGAAFTCGMNAGADSCWCASLPPVFAVPEAGAGQCYCPGCLKAKIAEAEGLRPQG
ncbi:cysteine-rich CWC family protein [Zoogloea sp.]|uniref:cysteine-rich CWC family protein n=1 Tax=Zoogloea sp. TaxID=49181 RepID=UPI00262A5EA8|nr:cysteine-rich CWC family protein [Zoogloea sp.]MDD3353204.1 cysteine-rich CWC family protein [Zoogloea sp.]